MKGSSCIEVLIIKEGKFLSCALILIMIVNCVNRRGICCPTSCSLLIILLVYSGLVDELIIIVIYVFMDLSVVHVTF